MNDQAGGGAIAHAAKPETRPARPYFSSGPCAKPPGWGPEHLALGSLGRSHRSKLGKAKLGDAKKVAADTAGIPVGTILGN